MTVLFGFTQKITTVGTTALCSTDITFMDSQTENIRDTWGHTGTYSGCTWSRQSANFSAQSDFGGHLRINGLCCLILTRTIIQMVHYTQSVDLIPTEMIQLKDIL